MTVSQHAIFQSGDETQSSNDAAAFVVDLSSLALTHRAVQHPYLQAIGRGELPDVRWALADYARHYYGYSCRFPCYLAAAISHLEEPRHRQALLDNMTEEAGSYEEHELQELERFGVAREWFVGIPHPVLFARFANALGADLDKDRESDQVACWHELFLAMLAHGSAAEAVGALGIGTENIVRTIYQPFIRAIDHVGDLAPSETVFFPLHVMVDDHHQATFQAIAADFASTEEGRRGLRKGMLKALNLRAGFWDWLYVRAMNPAGAENAI